MVVSLRRSLPEKAFLRVSVRSLCLCGEIPRENTHHRGTEIAQRHGDQFLRQTPERAEILQSRRLSRKLLEAIELFSIAARARLVELIGTTEGSQSFALA